MNDRMFVLISGVEQKDLDCRFLQFSPCPRLSCRRKISDYTLALPQPLIDLAYLFLILIQPLDTPGLQP